MPKFYNVTTPTIGSDDKTRYTRIGVAFPTKEGSNAFLSIKLDALPINGEMVLFEPKPREESES